MWGGPNSCLPFWTSYLPRSTLIDTSTLDLPAYDFQKVVGEFIGKDILDLSAEGKSPISFIITGVYSNIKVLNIAFKIRNEYGFPNVFVSPHLVGSKFQEAHLTALQVDFPNALVSVIPGLGQIYEKTNIKRAALNLDLYDSCRIEPPEVAGKLGEEQRAIIENLFMFHTSVKIKTLSGGFSGGLLFVAQGIGRGLTLRPAPAVTLRRELWIFRAGSRCFFLRGTTARSTRSTLGGACASSPCSSTSLCNGPTEAAISPSGP